MSKTSSTITLLRRLKAVNDFDLLEELAVETEFGIRNEMAIPAYFHGNILSRFIFFGRLARFLAPLDFAAGSEVLDFGCGTGVLAPYFVNRKCSYRGIDLTPEVARNYSAALNLSGAEFHHSINDLDPALKFDHIISFDVLEHVDNLLEILLEFRKMLIPKGWITICGPTENLLYRMGRKLVGFSGEYHHRNIEDIFAVAKQAGLVSTASRSWPLSGPMALFKCGYFKS